MNMTFDAWWEEFKPQLNPLDQNSSGPYIAEDGQPTNYAFATNGPEYQHILAISKTEPGRVWTLMESDGCMYIGSGVHLVNREAYYVTEKAFDGDYLNVVVFEEAERFVVQVNGEVSGDFEFENEEQATAYLFGLVLDDTDISDDDTLTIVRRLYEDGDYIDGSDDEMSSTTKASAFDDLGSEHDLSRDDYTSALDGGDTDADSYEDWLRERNREILSSIVGVDIRVKAPSM